MSFKEDKYLQVASKEAKFFQYALIKCERLKNTLDDGLDLWGRANHTSVFGTETFKLAFAHKLFRNERVGKDILNLQNENKKQVIYCG